MMRITRGKEGFSANTALKWSFFRRVTAPIAIVVASGLLTGCGVEVVAQPPASAPTSAEPAPAADPGSSESPAVVDVDPSAEPEPSASEAGEPTQADLARRSYYDNSIDLTTGCPTGRIVIDQSMRVTKITEDCKEVIVTAAFTTLLAEHVGTLTIKNTASHGHFLIRSIDKATVAAAFNHVYWDSGKPSVNVTGFKCVVQPNPVKEQK
jgi:hypothetical protein